MHGPEELGLLAARLAEAEADLIARERLVLESDPTAAELRALGEERDKLALDRDVLADAYDVAARRRDDAGRARDVAGGSLDRLRRDAASGSAAFPGDDPGHERDQAVQDRSAAADDRARAAADRARAAADRQHAANDREAAAVRETGLEHEIAGLRHALDTRLVIGQAEGLLMARHQVDEDAAFALLVRLSRRAHLKLRDIAARIVADATQDKPSTKQIAEPPIPQTDA